MSKEQLLKKSIFCFGNDEFEIEDDFIEGDDNIINSRLEEADLQLKYLEYTINCL